MARKRKECSVKSILTKEVLQQEYINNGLSLGKIAVNYGVSKSFICDLRKEYGIPKQQRWNTIEELKEKLAKKCLCDLYQEIKSDAKIGTMFEVNSKLVEVLRQKFDIPTILDGIGRTGELLVINELKKHFINVTDMNEVDQYSSYDVDISGIRIEVKTSTFKIDKRWSNGRKVWEFAISSTWRNRPKVSDIKREIRPGVFKKDFSKTCDYLILVGLSPEFTVKNYFIIPSIKLNKDLTTISIPVLSGLSKYDKYRTDILNSDNVRFLSPKGGVTPEQMGNEVDFSDDDIPFN